MDRLSNYLRRSFVVPVAAVLVFCCCAQRSQASILPLPSIVPSTWSDIHAGFVGSYDAATDVFSVNGGSRATSLYSAISGITYPLPASPLTAVSIVGLVVNGSGVVTTKGTLTITLPSATGPYPIGTLLLGEVDDIRFAATGKLELGFNVKGGSAANDFGGLNAMAGMKLNMVGAAGTGATAASFTSNFTFGSMPSPAQVDIVGPPVPEPVSIFVFAGLALTFAGLSGRTRDA